MTERVTEWTLQTDRIRLHLRGPMGEAGALRVQTRRAGAKPVWEPTDVALLEGAAYAVLLQSTTDAPVRLHHDSLPRYGGDPVVTNRLTPADEGRVWHGTLQLGAVAGRTRFRIDVEGRAEVAFALDVRPVRLHPHRDLAPMRREVEETLAGLALRYLRPADVPARETGGRRQAPATALRLLLSTLDDIERALATIRRRPRPDLERSRRLVPAARVRGVDAGFMRAVQQGKGGGRLVSGEIPVRERLLAASARWSMDTPEHRWLRARLRSAQQAVQEIAEQEARRAPSMRRRRARRDLASAHHRLGRLLQASPLADAGTGAGDVTPRLLRAPGYAEAYAACRRLRLSLDLTGGPSRASLVDLHELYEIWAYLAVLRAVARVLGEPVDPAAFVRAEPVGLRLALQTGRAHAVRFDTPGGPVAVAYQSRFGGGLLAQRPDLLLSAGRGGKRRRYVLDAKYRLDDAAGYVRRHGSPGPPEDALGDLHRYRDAIVERGDRTVREAVALFPFRESEPGAFGESRLWRSIETLGVGAIPLLPGETGYLDEWLRRVLERAVS